MLQAMFRALVIAAALTAGACRDARLEELQSIRNEVCACKTAACGEAAMKRLRQDGVRSDHVAKKLAKEMIDCLHKLYLSERPSTDPDAEAPAAPGGAGSAAAERP